MQLQGLELEEFGGLKGKRMDLFDQVVHGGEFTWRKLGIEKGWLRAFIIKVRLFDIFKFLGEFRVLLLVEAVEEETVFDGVLFLNGIVQLLFSIILLFNGMVLLFTGMVLLFSGIVLCMVFPFDFCLWFYYAI